MNGRLCRLLSELQHCSTHQQLAIGTSRYVKQKYDTTMTKFYSAQGCWLLKIHCDTVLFNCSQAKICFYVWQHRILSDCYIDSAAQVRENEKSLAADSPFSCHLLMHQTFEKENFHVPYHFFVFRGTVDNCAHYSFKLQNLFRNGFAIMLF